MGQPIQFKRGNEANLPTLASGEPAVTLDTGKMFVGTPGGNVELATASQLAQTAKKIDSQFINVMYPKAPLVGAKGDGLTDDTQVFKNILSYALRNNTNIYIPNGNYLISDTISYGLNTEAGVLSDKIEILGQHIRNTIITFKPTTNGIPLFKLGANSGYSILKNMTLVDGNTRQNTAIELQDYYDGANQPNWKNDFESLHVTGFNKGIVFNGGSDHSQDTHLDGSTLRKVAIWDYNIGIEINNTQAVQLYGEDVDFIATYAGAENSLAIVNNVGNTWHFKGGSWISKGTFIKFNASTWYNLCKFVLDGIRFELRTPYNKPLIAYSDFTEGYGRWNVSNFMDFTMVNCSGIAFSQVVKIIKTPVIGRVHFKDNYFTAGTFEADVYQTAETILSSGTSLGSKGQLLFDHCTPVKVNLITDADKYLGGNGLVPDVKFLNGYQNSSSASTRIDSFGFYTNIVDNFETSRDTGMVSYTRKITGIRIGQSNRLPNEVKMRLPSFAIPLNIIVSKSNSSNNIRLDYYYVKDNANWVNPSVFDYNTDAVKLGESVFSDYGTGGETVVIPIKVSTDIRSLTGASYSLKTDSSWGTWKEGRFLVRFIDKSTGALMTTSNTPLEFLMIEYI